ncbi:MarR family transcriptional regulator, partial [Dysosmobacter welbionis]
ARDKSPCTFGFPVQSLLLFRSYRIPDSSPQTASPCLLSRQGPPDKSCSP